jgi:excisionase family DNA binding protein
MSHTARQTADELGVAERTVRRWISSGDLAAEKQGGAFLIDLDAAHETFKRSRAGRSAERSSELAELRGRYLEVCERLTLAEAVLTEERARRKRLERVLYMPPLLKAEA